METEIIEHKPELRLILRPASDEPPSSSAEFQDQLRTFYNALKSEGVDTVARSQAYDAIGGGGRLTGEFTLALVTLGPVAIVQARKLIEAIFKTLAGGTMFEIRKGSTAVKGSARDVQKILTPEQLAKLFESHPPK
jgi:hypothetical protein